MRRNVAILIPLLAVLPSCGGGGSAPSAPTPPTTTAPPPSTTLAPAAGSPTLSVTYNPTVGKQPVKVGFSACDSRDANGGRELRYFVDFGDGNGLKETGECGFSHTFGSNGVTVYETNVCVENKSGGGTRQCKTQKIKTYVDVSIDVNRNTGCQKTVVATAQLKLGHDGFDVSAASQVDRVQFEAFNAAGNSLGTKEGSPASQTQWDSGTWNVNDDTKLRVKATVFSKGIAGNDTPEGDRLACGS